MNRRLGGPGIRRNLRGSGGAAAAAFTPLDLTPLAWYRETYAGGTWTDLSGNGRNLTQATPANQPTQVTRAGQLALSFDGGDSVFASFGSTITQPITLYCVAELAVATGATLVDGYSLSRLIVATTATPQWSMYAGLTVTAGTPATGTIYGVCFVANAASSNVYVNDFVSATITGNPGTNGLDGLTAGSLKQGSGNRLTGYEWEIIVYSGAHDAATRKKIGDYMSGRYTGLTITT